MSDTILVATRKGLFTVSRNHAGSWDVVDRAFLGDHVSMILPSRHDGPAYAALNHGHFGAKLHRLKQGGRTWEECGVPTYPERAEGTAPEINPVSQQEIPWKLMMIWALEYGGEDQSDVIWCGTIPGGLFKSTDSGESWELVRSLWDHPMRKQWFGGGADFPGIHSICVDPRTSDRVAVGVSCGGVWVTEDGGASWNCRADGMWAAYMPPERKYDPVIQDPHRVAQCRAAPDAMWVQHHNGVFRSIDCSASWTEVEHVLPSVFGFAVAAHPNDPETAWFVPAVNDECRIPVDGRVVVARTRDGGKTFEVLTHGLPQQDSYDLTYRHALDVDLSGERLVFGTTTGSLWISEDGGDSWKTISTHLPPIYCTRFVH